ncbi:MAG: hypothetical protein IJT40_05175 [Firmicutes bacterium]|nr:hypothetical protein [Bacillota bacterium]
MDRITVRVGVCGTGEGSRVRMVAHALDYYLNKRSRVRVFRKENDRYIVTEDPEDREGQDVIVCVIDPLPSSIKSGASGILDLKECTTPVIWLLNRKNPGVDMVRLFRFLGFHPDHVQDDVTYEALCRAEYGMYEICDMMELSGIRETAEHIERDWGPHDIR